jgi:hypothetical protein
MSAPFIGIRKVGLSLGCSTRDGSRPTSSIYERGRPLRRPRPVRSVNQHPAPVHLVIGAVGCQSARAASLVSTLLPQPMILHPELAQSRKAVALASARVE